LPVLDFECLRLGFGITYSSLSTEFGFQFLERRPTLVHLSSRASALALVQVSSAVWTKPSALFSAQSGHRQRKLYLLPSGVVDVDHIVLIKTYRKILFAQLPFLCALERRNIEQLERLLDGNRHRGKAPVALESHLRDHAACQLHLLGAASGSQIKLAPRNEIA